MKDQEKKEEKVLFPKIQKVIDERKKKKEQEVLEVTQYVQEKKDQAEEKFQNSLPYYEEFFYIQGILIKIILIKIMRAWYKPKQVIFNPWVKLKPIKITACLHRNFREDNERAFWTGSIGAKEEVSIRLYDLGKIPKLTIADSHGNKKAVNLRELTTGFQEFLWPVLEHYKKEYSLVIELDKKIDFFDLLKKFIAEMKVKRAALEKARKEKEAKDYIEDKRERKRRKTEQINYYKKIYKENRLIIRPKLHEVYFFIKNNTNYSLKSPFTGFLYGLQEETIQSLIHDPQLYNGFDTVIGMFCLPLTRSFYFWRTATLITAVLSVSYWEEKPKVYLCFRLQSNKEILNIKDILGKYVKIEANPPKEKLDEIIDSWLKEFIDNLRTEDLKDAPKEDPSIESSEFRREFLKNKKAK